MIFAFPRAATSLAVRHREAARRDPHTSDGPARGRVSPGTSSGRSWPRRTTGRYRCSVFKPAGAASARREKPTPSSRWTHGSPSAGRWPNGG